MDLKDKIIDLLVNQEFDNCEALVQTAVERKLLNESDSARIRFDANRHWWEDQRGKQFYLRRRGPEDFDFFKELVKTDNFVRRMHISSSGKISEQEILRRLNKNARALVTEARSLHWVIRSTSNQPFGLLSLSDFSFDHKRAFLKIGMHPRAPKRASVTAMLLAFQVFFRKLGFHKLCTEIYEDNEISLKGTQNIGFQIEGRLRDQIFDPHRKRYINMIQTGILAEEAFSERNSRLYTQLVGSEI